jgi:hypothetical protein
VCAAFDLEDIMKEKDMSNHAQTDISSAYGIGQH